MADCESGVCDICRVCELREMVSQAAAIHIEREKKE